MDVYIARQPINDRKNHIYAYEILFRDKKPDIDGDQGTVMSATTVHNLINVMGIDNVIGRYYGIIKITPLFLQRNLIEALPKEKLIFSIFEKDLNNPSFIETIIECHTAGYTFALNDAQTLDILHFPKLLKILSYIKLDTKILSPTQIKKLIDIAKKYNIKTIGTKIETKKRHRDLFLDGCDYFQGFYFSEPEMIEEKPIKADIGAILILWNLIRNDVSTDELVDAFEREHAITLQLLRFINSAFFSLRSTVTSIRQLITFLGRDQLSKWLIIMLFAKEGQKEGGNHPLVIMVINRTELMVGLDKLIHPNAPKSEMETAYLVGMLSLIHLLLHRPPREILHHLHVSNEIENALFEATCFYGKLLQMVRILENNDMEKIDEMIDKYHIPEKAINKLSIETMKKVNAFDEAINL